MKSVEVRNILLLEDGVGWSRGHMNVNVMIRVSVLLRATELFIQICTFFDFVFYTRK
jgi:hypothetical protein